jgi:inhibitor of cysteine peptidase
MPGMRIGRIALAVGMAIIGLGCTPPGSFGTATPVVMIDDSANGSTVSLRRGEGLVISLTGNPTTGFTWEMGDSADEILAQQGKPEYSAGSRALGAGGKYRFHFQAEREGTARVRLVYRRPFEASVPPAQIFEVTVVVSP